MAARTALKEDTGKISYVIPSRTITGSVPELLEEIDDMIDALRLVRDTIAARAPKPARPPATGWRARLQEVRGRVRQLSAKR